MSRSTSALPDFSGPVKTWNVWGTEQGEKSRVMLDSSYTQAFDPNSMRNKGTSRNAVYVFGQGKTSKAAGSLRSYGGRIRNVHQELVQREAVLRKRCGVGPEYDYDNFDDASVDPYDSYHAFVRLNDYTKNISEPLFSSGLLKSSRGANGRPLTTI